MASRRDFLKWTGYSAAALGSVSLPTIAAVARGLTTPGSAGLRLETAPTSGKPFRMTEPWYRQTIARLQQKLGERGLKGMIFSDSHNLNYLAGYFLTNTERPAWLFIPTDGQPAMFSPGLDRDMLSSWWIKDYDWYFDYPHAGPFNQVVFDKGPQVDLVEWMLKGIARRGFGEGKIGVDREMGPKTQARWSAALPKAEFVDASEIPLKMRQVKTAEEITLVQVAIDYHDKIMEFARNLIAQKGVGLHDAAVRRATEEYGEQLVFADFQVTGRAHNAAGFRLWLSCRAGVATAYPHPNQYFYKKIARGDAVQVSGVVQVGGYGGEGYRALHLEPIPDLGRKMWEVHTEMTLAQAEESKPGRECREVAEKVLKIAQQAGLEKYIYHRPAHGEGMEGHQPPYIALGDATVLEEGMMFSNEPGLYNPADGYGYNHSNNVLVTKSGGVRMNKAPLTKEFCWIKTGSTTSSSR